jgi:D-alanyl-D-alanine carboxypeptidase
MNRKAKELGMENTNFSNPHGLSDIEHYSTPRDMAILSRYALQNDTFKKIVGLKKYIITPKNSEYIRYCYNHNKLLFNYEGTTGIKTGYTKLDGRCLVSSVERNGVELICVTFNGADHWNDHKNLYEESFKKLEKRTLSAKGENAFEISVVGGKSNFVTAVNNAAIELYLPIDADIETKVYLPPFVYAPISKGEIIGELRIYCNNQIIHTVALCSIENIEVKKISFFKKIFG